MNLITVLRSTGLRVVHTFYEDGAPIAADGNVTYTVAKADGTTLTSGTAAHVASPHSYTFDLQPQAALNLLTVTWSGVFGGLTQTQTDQIEVVGAYYATLAELRALPGLSNAASYPNDTLIELRREFEDIAERYCGVAFIPRYAREQYAGPGFSKLLLRRIEPRVLLSVTAKDSAGAVTTFTTANWRLTPIGELFSEGIAIPWSIYGDRNITIEYEHGLDTPPAQIIKACKDYVAAKAIENQNRIGRDILSRTDPAGFSERWSTPDWNAGRPTGYLDVDRALNSIGRVVTVA